MSYSFRPLFMIFFFAVLLSACGEDDTAAPPVTPAQPPAETAAPAVPPPVTAEPAPATAVPAPATTDTAPVAVEPAAPPPSALSHPVVYQEEIYKNWPYTSPPPAEAATTSGTVESQVQSALSGVEEKVAAAVEEKIETTTTAAAEQAGVGPAAVVAQAQQAAAGGGQTHTINAEARAFNPDIVYIQPGDTVSWINMTSHNTVSIEGLIPSGAEPWRGQIGENYKVTLTVEGIYGYVCEPHIGFGMMGVIVVGKPSTLDTVKAYADKNLQGPYRRILGKLNKVKIP